LVSNLDEQNLVLPQLSTPKVKHSQAVVHGKEMFESIVHISPNERMSIGEKLDEVLEMMRASASQQNTYSGIRNPTLKADLAYAEPDEARQANGDSSAINGLAGNICNNTPMLPKSRSDSSYDPASTRCVSTAGGDTGQNESSCDQEASRKFKHRDFGSYEDHNNSSSHPKTQAPQMMPFPAKATGGLPTALNGDGDEKPNSVAPRRVRAIPVVTQAMFAEAVNASGEEIQVFLSTFFDSEQQLPI